MRNPQPCGLTTSAVHLEENACLRSRLVTVMGISTRNRVLRRVALGVSISMRADLAGICTGPHTSLTEAGLDAAVRKREFGLRR